MTLNPELHKRLTEEAFYPQGAEAKLAYALPPHKSTIGMKDIHGVGFGLTATYITNGYMDVFFSRKGMKQVAEALLARQRNEPHILENIEENWRAQREPFEKLVRQLRNTNLKEKSLQELLALFNEVAEKGYLHWKHIVFIDAFDPEGDTIVTEAVRKAAPALLPHWSTLTRPWEPSYVQQEQQALLELARWALTHGHRLKVLNAQASEQLPQEAAQRIRQHADAFYWYKNNYASIRTLDAAFFLNQLKMIVKAHTIGQVTEQIEKAEEEIRQGTAQQDRLLEKAPEQLKTFLAFFQKMTTLRDQRKVSQLLMVTAMRWIIEEVARQSGSPLDLLENMAFWETDRLLHDKENFLEELRRRNERVLTVASERWGMMFITGAEAEGIKTKMEQALMRDSSELAGRPASPGNVQGTVKVVNKVTDFGKFCAGDILVSAMTRPEFVPLMRKAAAIVTDEGGITCHAAIVSRELKIPCVVGTEIATKVFKDGDIVEVDANHGVVRKIR